MRKKAYNDAEDAVVPCTRKRKVCVADDDKSDTSNQPDAEPAWPSKRLRKATGSGKENHRLSASADKKGKHGRKTTAVGGGKVKAKERSENASLATVTDDRYTNQGYPRIYTRSRKDSSPHRLDSARTRVYGLNPGWS